MLPVLSLYMVLQNDTWKNHFYFSRCSITIPTKSKNVQLLTGILL